jgi:hypothetical protein
MRKIPCHAIGTEGQQSRHYSGSHVHLYNVPVLEEIVTLYHLPVEDTFSPDFRKLELADEILVNLTG